MSFRTATVTLMACWVTFGAVLRVSANGNTNGPEKDAVLQIYLPRKITVKNAHLTLGQVTILRGDEASVTKASKIPVGRISLPGQKVVVDRVTILSRLACNGIPACNVALTGAEETAVKRWQQVIEGPEFVELARSFLKKEPPADGVCQSDPVGLPKDLVLPGSTQDIDTSTQLVKSAVRNQAKVRITVMADGREIDMREVTLRLKYHCRKAVTLAEIPTGAVIGAENVTIENVISDYPEPPNWRPPYGLIARRRLPADTVIGPTMVSRAKSAVLIRRNETVVIRVEMPGLLVTAMGKTMQEGRAGEYIKIRNLDSQRIILCKVNEDATVEPVF